MNGEPGRRKSGTDRDDEAETTLVCPDCDSANVQRARSGSMVRRSDPTAPDHLCRECDKAVEPTERAADPSGGALQGKAKQLDQLDPEDLGLGEQ